MPDPGRPQDGVLQEPERESSAAPSGDEALAELVEGDEEAVGASEAGLAASEALLALGRAARCFLIYSPENEAIRHFLEALREKMRAYFDRFGEMELQIRPWEMLLGDEVVYVNRDRERSLAFRLYRDGVRRVTFQPDVTWEEITRFLGIVSIRFTGIRQQEDDIVTLLWKAGFQHIDVDAVEGFVPEDDESEAEAAQYASLGARNAVQAMFLEAPYSFDVPWPEFKERARVAYRPPDPRELEKLAEEDSTRALPGQCVRLVKEILEIAANPVEPMQLEEAAPLFKEIRDFLLSEGLLSSVLEMVRVIDQAPFREKDIPQKEALLRGFADARALARIIHSVPEGQREAPPELLELMDLIPGDKLTLLLDILERERGLAARRITRQLIVREGSRRIDYIVSHIHRVEASVAVDLLHALTELDMERARRVAMDLTAHPDVEVKLAALGVLERARYDQQLGLRVAQLLRADQQEVRLRALKLLVEHRDRWAFNPIVAHLENDVLHLDREEAQALGEALAQIWEKRAFHQFRKWIQQKKLFRRVLPGQQLLKWAAVSGLVLVEDPEAETLIRRVSESAGEDLHRHCVQCLVRRRHRYGRQG